MAKWHILYTRKDAESKVIKALKSRGIESYIPYVDKGKKKSKGFGLFPRKVFVKTAVEELATLKEIDGVINPVYFHNRPAEVSDIELASIKHFLTENKSVEVQTVSIDSAKNLSEVSHYRTSKVKEDNGKEVEVLKMHLPSLGCLLVAESDRIKVKVLATAKPIAELAADN